MAPTSWRSGPAIERKITTIWSHVRFTPKTLEQIEAGAVADFDVLLGEQEKLAVEQRQRLIQLERQKSINLIFARLRMIYSMPDRR